MTMTIIIIVTRPKERDAAASGRPTTTAIAPFHSRTFSSRYHWTNRFVPSYKLPISWEVGSVGRSITTTTMIMITIIPTWTWLSHPLPAVGVTMKIYDSGFVPTIASFYCPLPPPPRMMLMRIALLFPPTPVVVTCRYSLSNRPDPNGNGPMPTCDASGVVLPSLSNIDTYHPYIHRPFQKYMNIYKLPVDRLSLSKKKIAIEKNV